MRVAAFSLTIGLPDVCQTKKAAIAALPIRHSTLRKPVATPEEVTRIRPRTGRQVAERLHEESGEWHENWSAGFGLVQQKIVTLKTASFECHRVSDTKTAPAHQERQRAQPDTCVLDGDITPSWITVEISRLNDSLEFGGREIVGWDLFVADVVAPE